MKSIGAALAKNSGFFRAWLRLNHSIDDPNDPAFLDTTKLGLTDFFDQFSQEQIKTMQAYWAYIIALGKGIDVCSIHDFWKSIQEKFDLQVLEKCHSTHIAAKKKVDGINKARKPDQSATAKMISDLEASRKALKPLHDTLEAENALWVYALTNRAVKILKASELLDATENLFLDSLMPRQDQGYSIEFAPGSFPYTTFLNAKPESRFEFGQSRSVGIHVQALHSQTFSTAKKAKTPEALKWHLIRQLREKLFAGWQDYIQKIILPLNCSDPKLSELEIHIPAMDYLKRMRDLLQLFNDENGIEKLQAIAKQGLPHPKSFIDWLEEQISFHEQKNNTQAIHEITQQKQLLREAFAKQKRAAELLGYIEGIEDAANVLKSLLPLYSGCIDDLKWDLETLKASQNSIITPAEAASSKVIRFKPHFEQSSARISHIELLRRRAASINGTSGENGSSGNKDHDLRSSSSNEADKGISTDSKLRLFHKIFCIETNSDFRIDRVLTFNKNL